MYCKNSMSQRTASVKVPDIRKTFLSAQEKMAVGDLVSENTPQVNTWDSADRVIERMEKHGVQSIPVVDEASKFVGVISERDVLSIGILIAADSWGRFDEESPLSSGIRARDLMDECAQTVSPGQNASYAAVLMLNEQLDCIPVVEDSKLVGLLTHADFTRKFADQEPSVMKAA